MKSAIRGCQARGVSVGLALAAHIGLLSGCPGQPGGGDGGVQETVIDGPLTVNENISLGGVVIADSVAIADGATLTATDDLVLRSQGPVVIAGTLSAMTLADRGADLTIESAGPIEISGQILAGPAPPVADATVEGNAVGTSGAEGGSVTLKSQGDITIAVGATIASGDGGAGGSATAMMELTGVATKRPSAGGAAAQVSNGELTAEGGNGGAGGSLVIDAVGIVRVQPSPTGQPVFVVGSGGNGGNAVALANEEVEGLNGLLAMNGGGGTPGELLFSAAGLEGLTFDEFPLEQPTEIGGAMIDLLWVLTGDSINVFRGGDGGNAGFASAGATEADLEAVIAGIAEGITDIDNVPFHSAATGLPRTKPLEADAARAPKQSTVGFQQSSCPPSGGTNGLSARAIANAPGAPARFAKPGAGGDAYAIARDGQGMGKGGDAFAQAAKGGDLFAVLPLSFKLPGSESTIGLTIGANQIAGLGGLAFARGGDGGPVGGSGGNAEATGGKGGNAPGAGDFELVPIPTSGGFGRYAEARGGDARDGMSCCNPERAGQQGGAGGTASARGGDGGDGHFGGVGGHVETVGGRAGNGGDGQPSGFAGTAGATTPVPGAGGRGRVRTDLGLTTNNGVILADRPGAAGSRGSACPPPPGPLDKIALSNETAAGRQNPYESFSTPIIDAQGTIYFTDVDADFGTAEGIWTHRRAGTVSPLALSGQQAPVPPQDLFDPPQMFGLFSSVNSASGGRAAFGVSVTQMGHTLWRSSGSSTLTLVSPAELFAAPDPESFSADSSGNVVFLYGTEMRRASSAGTINADAASFEVVARLGDSVPGLESVGVTFAAFSEFVVSPDGVIAFQARLSGTTVMPNVNDLGIFRFRAGTLETLVLSGDAVPDSLGGGRLRLVAFGSTMDDLAIRTGGEVYFRSFPVNSTNPFDEPASIWAVTAPNQLARIVEAGRATPVLNETAEATLTTVGAPVVNADGTVAFFGGETGKANIWTVTSGGLRRIFSTEASAPGTASMFFSFEADSLVLTRGAAQVAPLAFIGLLDDSGTDVDQSNDRGLWAQDPSGRFVLVAREGNVLKNASQTFGTVSSLQFAAGTGNADGRRSGFSDNGDLTFLAVFTDGSSGIFRANPGAAVDPAGGVLVR